MTGEERGVFAGQRGAGGSPSVQTCLSWQLTPLVGKLISCVRTPGRSVTKTAPRTALPVQLTPQQEYCVSTVGSFPEKTLPA